MTAMNIQESTVTGIAGASPRGLLLRPFAETDRSACQGLAARAAMSSYGRDLEGMQGLFTPDTPLATVEQRLVALLDGILVGFVDLEGRHITNLFVDPERQGHGFGTLLLRHVEAALGTPLTVSCFAVNTRARRFYERFGFTVSGEDIIPFPEREAHVWRMTLARPAPA